MQKKIILITALTLSAPFAMAQDYANYGMDILEMNKEGKVSKISGFDGGSYSFDEDKMKYKFENHDKQTKRKIVQEIKVEKAENKKISRISNKSFSSEDGKDDEDFITYSLVSDDGKDADASRLGKATSITSCSKTSSMMFVGKNFKCVTVNKQLCDYLEKDVTKNLLTTKLEACTKVIEEMQAHQTALQEMTVKDYEDNISHISSMSGRMSKEKSIFSTEVVDLGSLSHITEASKDAQSACADLKILLVDKLAAAVPEVDKEQAPKKKSWWKKVKGGVNKVNPF
ncbi:MAG TPA: hypothetical protein VNJ01_10370 [Bacteriovoracaceae bacterium]|nr:hypothetical protein [Bacteriovoracaceae bacterium]